MRVVDGVALLHALPATAGAVPRFHTGYFAWLALGAMGQLAATAFLLAAMKQRNFVVGVAYSKTDALQVALFAALFLHELPGWVTLLAMGLATGGVVLLSLPRGGPAALAGNGTRAWTGAAAAWGLASGAGFALSAVGYRGAALQLPDVSPWLAGGWGVLWAQALQTVVQATQGIAGAFGGINSELSAAINQAGALLNAVVRIAAAERARATAKSAQDGNG